MNNMPLGGDPEAQSYGPFTKEDAERLRKARANGYTPLTQPERPTSAPAILQAAQDAIADRAAVRDTGAERSMGRCVKAFNAMTGHALTEVQGWQFMELLKMARSQGGRHSVDDYTDGAAYAALAGEAAGRGDA